MVTIVSAGVRLRKRAGRRGQVLRESLRHGYRMLVPRIRQGAALLVAVRRLRSGPRLLCFHAIVQVDASLGRNMRQENKRSAQEARRRERKVIGE